MLKKAILIFCSLFLLNTVSADSHIDPRILESRKAVQELAERLVNELSAAMTIGGPENAVKVCHIYAPKTTDTVSEKFQMQVGRTSLKTRNPNNNPDEWERKVLEQFEQRLKDGGDPSKLEYSEETGDGFRYMKAIPTKGLCLTCHGENIQEPLKETLSELYPQDNATGFKEGDLRGAFTILQTK